MCCFVCYKQLNSPNSIKCYKLQLDPMPFAQADAYCHSLGFGTADAHLMQIRDRAELLTAMRLCRGTK